MIPVDRTSNNTPSSPCIETTKQCEERYRLNSLDRTTSLKLKVMDDHQCDSLPDHCKTNVIINKLGSSPVLDDNVYSEVNPKIPELTYVQLGDRCFADTSGYKELNHEIIVEENSEIESLYDDPLAVSCPSLPSMHKISVTPSRSLYTINKGI